MLAIHHRPGSFSDKWIEYCQKHNVPYKQVDCFASDIIEQMRDCGGLMWHWAHFDYKTVLFARQLTYSLETMGKKVFPNCSTCWHFDDKVGQKYLLEAVGAPLIPSYVFYDKEVALGWADTTVYPKVFKLRGGAGAANVKLVRSREGAIRLIQKAFGEGFKSAPSYLNDYKKKTKRIKSVQVFWQKLKRMPATLQNIRNINRNSGREMGYVYFQDFIPDNSFDIRVIVIGDRAFAIKRLVRPGDFRASGSGNIVFDPAQIDIRCVEIAFETTVRLDGQCLAYDFVFGNGNPLVVEISYGFSAEAYAPCPGFWSRDLSWNAGTFSAQYFIIEDFIENSARQAE